MHVFPLESILKNFKFSKSNLRVIKFNSDLSFKKILIIIVRNTMNYLKIIVLKDMNQVK